MHKTMQLCYNSALSIFELLDFISAWSELMQEVWKVLEHFWKCLCLSLKLQAHTVTWCMNQRATLYYRHERPVGVHGQAALESAMHTYTHISAFMNLLERWRAMGPGLKTIDCMWHCHIHVVLIYNYILIVTASTHKARLFCIHWLFYSLLIHSIIKVIYYYTSCC